MRATRAFDGEAEGFVVPLWWRERRRGNGVLGDELGVIHGVEILVDELEDSMLQLADYGGLERERVGKYDCRS